ncbi:MAG: cob(I)yrinic acid a,c-diamide adenosyltransferase [Candidatus Tantalella remota]|nr:cob(I)yrinic acid a,c-diamide adenosyltransferase [Candidatus Tantalella remota]
MSSRTGNGDKGFTEVSFHKKVSKSSAVIHAIGDLDELSSYLGLVKSKIKSNKEKNVLEKMQHAVSTIASEISVGADKRKKLGHLLGKDETDWIEKTLIDLERKAVMKSSFHLSGEGEISALLDVARSVARRAERSVVVLFCEGDMKNGRVMSYLNCLSDVLFVMARRKAASERRVKARRRKEKK